MNADLKEKVEVAIKRLQDFAPKDGSYHLAFSGGKDSIVIKKLADMAGVKYDAHYRVTSVDPPELAAFIRDYHPDVHRDIPRYPDGKPITMWNLIPKKRMMPTRLARYCCEYLKEDAGDGQKTITGVRWAESVNRKRNQGLVTVPKKYGNEELEDDDNFTQTSIGGYILTNDNEESRRVLETCYKHSKILINPIIDWTDRNVWDFIHEMKMPYCKLYDEGLHRIGCIGCPMASTNMRLFGFRRWPKYKHLYENAMRKLIAIYHSPDFKGHARWERVEDMWNWWMLMEVAEGQIGFDQMGDDDDE